MEQAAMQSGPRDTMGGADGSQPTSAAASSWVINLCASMTPNQISPILVPGIDAYRVYQISRNEDGRQRYRLRIGFFDNQSEARELLTKLRELYPAAFVTSLCNEDQKFARGYTTKPKPAPMATPAEVEATLTASRPTPPPAVKAERPAPAAPSARAAAVEPAKSAAPREPVVAAATPPAAAAKKVEAPSTATPTPAHAPAPAPAPAPEVSAPVLTLDVEWEATPAATSAPVADKATPFHVGRGVALPKVEFELLTDDTPAELGHQPTVEPEETRLATARVDTDLEPPKTMRTPIPLREPKQLDANAPLPSFDSTITIRALTNEELEDESQQQWFVVQLAASEQPVNLETMPRLDIFTAYRLYSVATKEARTVTHSLRLGFFTESVSAEAVCGYLKTFFGSPRVVRISTAEQLRFSQEAQPKVFSDPSPTGQVIELSTPKPVKPIQLEPKPTPGVDRRQAPRHDKDMAALEMKLMEEARLTETGIRRMEKNSLLSRLVGKLTK